MAVDNQWAYMIIIRRIVCIVSQKLRYGGRVSWNGGGIGRRRPATLIIKEMSIGTSPNDSSSFSRTLIEIKDRLVV